MEIKTIRELLESKESRNILEELDMNRKIIDDPIKCKEWFKKSFLDSLEKKWIAVDDLENYIKDNSFSRNDLMKIIKEIKKE